ncbi:MAG: tRNA (adenosine(37)-N6)-threonylcarbamoyltransferase complex dimerization subunit type 1 TsaB [Oscillospiraceae bacterium]|nr:tRNA (adenosine(37)-N6)-threonylcarbamoyltransferase complex dimerization subunit type 1 TsaB [Oscillospiraceae bacterium]MBR4194782.1 tRNA (adenosine(37)-N6)-threonylcarbamoyltransferase complex dimerization subunit type 1 TsaB [Oscillospiraceae bacterium]MBR4655896.1 tRNA (adenosine(37)-N6)-threonylcarbamoyltransferase complex dimerization subunit type 1 TsaB [Oscillospiraceae bacterium]
MRILAFETSAKAASVALLTDGALTAESFQNSGLTHSRTIMKLAQDLLETCELSPADLDFVAWANGPGSFTGIRIGAAAAKGLCWGLELPALPVSTLEAMAWNAVDLEGVICCCMDARRSQVYNALFRARDGALTRLREDRAISLDELAADLVTLDGPIHLVGDGALLSWENLRDRVSGLHLISEHMRQQRAAGVGLAGWRAVLLGKAENAALSVPNYLRLSQAERERLAKETHKGE